jgi:ferric-dicitrate binding protein FerR (iron transport regulator)
MKHAGTSFGPCLILLALLFFRAAPIGQPDSHAPYVAGHITALLPVDQVLRQDKTLVAAKDMNLFLDEVVKTDRGGRVRIALADGSILNVGSDAQLHILQHGVKHQETTLELLYGRLVLTAVKISRPHGKFEVRTPIAVAGVVGTKFGLRAESSYADVVCEEGTVRVCNTDSRVPGEVLFQAGQFTHVERGKPPSPPAPASPERIQAGEDATSIPD